MEIIKDTYNKTTECFHCGSTFLYNEKDIEPVYPSTDYKEEYTSNYFFIVIIIKCIITIIFIIINSYIIAIILVILIILKAKQYAALFVMQ